MERLLVGARRFFKGFIAGGIGAVVIFLSAGVKISNLGDARNVGLMILGAFITGGVLAVEKMYNFTLTPPAQ